MSTQVFGPWAAMQDSVGSHVVVSQRQRYKDWGDAWEPHSSDANVCMSIGDHTEPALAGHDSQAAIARLIAAAPDMLAALEQAVTSLQDSGYPNTHAAVLAARQAIRKATGHTEEQAA